MEKLAKGSIHKIKNIFSLSNSFTAYTTYKRTKRKHHKDCRTTKIEEKKKSIVLMLILKLLQGNYKDREGVVYFVHLCCVEHLMFDCGLFLQFSFFSLFS